jgi:hypothetical protein
LHIEDGGAHRAVIKDDSVADCLYEVGHGLALSGGT